MADVVVNNGEVILQSDTYDLKIDHNRIIYYKKREDKKFISIGKKVPKGLTLDEKKNYIVMLYKENQRKRTDE